MPGHTQNRYASFGGEIDRDEWSADGCASPPEGYDPQYSWNEVDTAVTLASMLRAEDEELESRPPTPPQLRRQGPYRLWDQPTWAQAMRPQVVVYHYPREQRPPWVQLRTLRLRQRTVEFWWDYKRQCKVEWAPLEGENTDEEEEEEEEEEVGWLHWIGQRMGLTS